MDWDIEKLISMIDRSPKWYTRTMFLLERGHKFSQCLVILTVNNEWLYWVCESAWRFEGKEMTKDSHIVFVLKTFVCVDDRKDWNVWQCDTCRWGRQQGLCCSNSFNIITMVLNCMSLQIRTDSVFFILYDKTDPSIHWAVRCFMWT